VCITAEVAAPQLELLTNRLDFGLVRLRGSETRLLRFRNASQTCAAEWKLQELVRVVGPGGRRVHQLSTAPMTGFEDVTCLECYPDAGKLEPDEEVEVRVICHGWSDGQHHSTIQAS
jgi:hypothetical protein